MTKWRVEWVEKEKTITTRKGVTYTARNLRKWKFFDDQETAVIFADVLKADGKEITANATPCKLTAIRI